MKLKSIALATIATVSIAAPADAAVYLISYQGIVTASSDSANAFGLGLNTFNGLSYQADYLFDDSIIVPVTDGLTYTAFHGGLAYGATSPIISAKLTINNISTFFSSQNIGEFVIANNQGGYDQSTNTSRNIVDGPSTYFTSTLSNNVLSNFNNFINSLLLSGGVNYTTQPGDSASGFTQIYSRDKATNTATIDSYALLTPTSITISSVSAVPEPASWAMFISGFGIIGGGMRYRQRRRSISFA